MLEHIKRVLDNASVTPEDAAALAPLVVTPPAGTFDAAELGAANAAQVALLAAIVTAGRSQQFGTALQRLLGCVDAAQASLSTYDRGRFWHLKGVAAWRLDDALYSATRALNRGIALLQGLETLAAQAYLGRIFDTFGQILQHQGLLHDARLEFERALVCKRAGKDRYGMALTLGNLGRLCMELDDFAAAARYLRRDLRLISVSRGISLLPVLTLRRWRRVSVTPYARAATASSPTLPESTALSRRTRGMASSRWWTSSGL